MNESSRARRPVAALLLSCHPAPTVAVTVFAVVLAVSADVRPGTTVLLAIAVLTGQLTIGWTNDLIDRGRDAQAGRQDKPLAAGAVAPRAVVAAISTAVAATVIFSLLLGWRAGVIHLAAVGCGWAYNARLKWTVLSWLPYGLAFAALPAVATFAAPGHPDPAWWVLAAGALLGIAAHFANVLPDIEADRAAGVRGVPQRIGARPSAALAAGLLLAGTSIATFGPAGPVLWPSAVVLALQAAVIAVATVALWRRPDGRGLFFGLMALAGLDIVVIAVATSITAS